MPIARIERTRDSLPSGYQYGDALDPAMRGLMESYGACQYCGRGITLCSAFPCEHRAMQRAAVREFLDSLLAKRCA